MSEKQEIFDGEMLPATRADEAQVPVATEMYVGALSRFKLHKKMVQEVINYTEAHDWFNYGKVVRLSAPRSESIYRILGLQAFNLKRERQELPNGYYQYMVTADVGFSAGQTLNVVGFCRASKPLFATKNKESVPADDIDEGNVIKNADSDFIVNAVGRFAGIRGLTPEDIERLSIGKIKAANMQKVDFGGRAVERSEEESGQAESTWQQLLEMNGQSVEKAKSQLQKLTAFTGKDGKQFTGYTDIKKVSAGVLKNLVGKVANLHKTWLKESCGGNQQQGEAPEITLESVSAEMGNLDLAGLAAYWNAKSKNLQEVFGADFPLIEAEKNRIKANLQQGKPANG